MNMHFIADTPNRHYKNDDSFNEPTVNCTISTIKVSNRYTTNKTIDPNNLNLDDSWQSLNNSPKKQAEATQTASGQDDLQ